MVFGQLAAIALAALIGLSLGALGAGGSIITVPLLVYVGHVPPKSAVGMSLVIVGVTSLVGASVQFKRGNLALKPALLFALTGMIGSFLGTTGTHLIPARTLMLLFSGVMLIVGWIMWRGLSTVRKAKTCNVNRCLVAGFFVGVLTGFFGVGGGFLIVPALVFFAGLDTRMAAGTSLGVITFNCATGLLGQLRYVEIDWRLLSTFLAVALIGMIVGLTVSGRLPEYRLRRILAIVILVLGVSVGLENLL
jgi:uncharacterized membrane protein YfcA